MGQRQTPSDRIPRPLPTTYQAEIEAMNVARRADAYRRLRHVGLAPHGALIVSGIEIKSVYASDTAYPADELHEMLPMDGGAL